jgi:hypothetical protein
MANKQEMIGGIEFLIQEGRRIGAALDDGAWAKAHDNDGWKNKEILAHVAGIGTIVVPFVQGMANAQPGADAGAGMDIDALNAGLVGARAGKSVQELVDEIATAYGGVIEFVRSQPDEFWQQKRTFAGFAGIPLGDLLMRMIVLHGLAHIYSAYSAVAFG